MNLITPYHLRDLIQPASSMAMVGNSRSLLDSQNGPIIDASDVVVRFNAATTRGFEIHVGTKTDILCCNVHQNSQLAPNIDQGCAPKAIVAFLTHKDSNTDISRFTAWVRDTPICLSFVPDLIRVSPATRLRTLTTGTYAFYFFQWLFDFKQIHLCGFNFFSGTHGNSGHYWTDIPPPGPIYHDLAVDKKIFQSLVQNFDGKFSCDPQTKSSLSLSMAQAKMRRRSFRKKLASRAAWQLIRWGMRIRQFSEKT